ncbi:heavy metal translocating P-type ATPase [Fusicatenibacter saccharivorans]|uniref:heavy metal translocating P-type ATPase n=1 Tax=Fusicatenibacter saccharivorans TaxID=1150298 RepID=UPI0015714487|nr:heavy metal translocating P-type ATPase [Fusicatenibacter saccharivorans]NSD24109.1 heavy metal translocating P-type ATPase [Fusicatenibacter saccharivorans]NSD80556.1 heavy metal translocating P-type ATPase [Fusicatenibacter saccharivorans]
MKFYIKHESRGRIRIHLAQKRMSSVQAETLLYYLQNQNQVSFAKVYDRTGDAVICYEGERAAVIRMIQLFHYEEVELPTGLLESSGRALNNEYQEKLISKVIYHFGRKWLLPAPIRAIYTTVVSVKYIWKGIQTLAQGKIEVPVLDATAIGVSMLRGDYGTAGSVMFLLGVGELLEEWTHKKSVGDLARSMSLNVGKVWLKKDGQEILVPSEKIVAGDEIVVHMGNLIPFDGEVSNGEGMVNQASLTGESVPVRRTLGSVVYAGTVLEEGELTILVKQTGGSSRYEKITAMIEESEKLKSGLESKAEHLADRLVPYSLGGTALTYLLTRNATKALSILMVDFSCALKLAMPISVLSAIREANQHKITVKGGKFLEAVAEADTIVFDKTGTLTKAQPTVAEVVSFSETKSPDELLRIAACLEEHFPHSMAKAVVDAAKEKHLDHEEMHSKVEYIVAHGISTTINGKKAIIGSYHFVFEDENSIIPEGMEEKFRHLPEEYSHLYLALEGVLAAVICIEDPLRPEAAEIIRQLKKAGLKKIVMMTGDSERTAKAIAKKVGVDEYYAEVLPEDKANFVEKEKAEGRKIIMIGDGINDSPALSAADVGIAISEGAEIAREIADITVAADDLAEILVLRMLSNRLMKRIHKNYRFIVTFNAGLILLGVGGILQPTTSALLHNTSTLYIGLKSMGNLLDEPV